MATGSSSSMPPKPVPAWLNSSAWASNPRSPVRSSYSFKEISTIQRETTSAAPVGEIGGQEEKDPSSSSSGGGSVRGAVTHQQTATLTTQARGNGLGNSSQQVKFVLTFLYDFFSVAIPDVKFSASCVFMEFCSFCSASFHSSGLFPAIANPIIIPNCYCFC
jgi:hypothetical protein